MYPHLLRNLPSLSLGALINGRKLMGLEKPQGKTGRYLGRTFGFNQLMIYNHDPGDKRLSGSA